MITDISVKNIKAIKAVELNNLKNVNYFVGPNGSGKSTILELLRLVSIIKSRGRSGEMGIRGYGNPNAVFRDKNRFSFQIDVNPGGSLPTADINFRVSNQETLSINSSSTIVNEDRISLGMPSGIPLNARYFSTNANNGLEEVDGVPFVDSTYVYDKNQLTSSILNSETLKAYLNKYFCAPGEAVDMLYSDTDSSKTIRVKIIKKGDRNQILREPDQSLKSLSGGFHHLIGLYFSIMEFIEELDSPDIAGVFLLEEPEVSLHPKLQKAIPEMLADISADRNIQFIVATHSPFMISAATGLNQKVYLFDDGNLVDLQGTIKEKSNGYTEGYCLGAVAKMLGAGLDDLNLPANTQYEKFIVYCEGHPDIDRQDAELYSIIFADEKNMEFISVGGANDCIKSLYQALPVAPILYGPKVECLAFIDRSCSNKGLRMPNETYIKTSATKPMFSDDEREEWLKYNSGYRMLLRKEIENYLFDPLVVDCLSVKDQKILENFRKKTTIDFKSGEVKDKLPATLKSDHEIYKKLAYALFKNRGTKAKVTYQELRQCLTSNEFAQ